MKITSKMLESLGASKQNAARYADTMDALLQQHKIDTPLRVAHFLAQVFHESGSLGLVRENMNYSEEGLLKTFKKYFTPAQAKSYAKQPERIGNRVYADRLGNGNEASGDGYRYRGRGFIQLTGRSNYRAFATFVGDDVVADPEKVADRYPVHASVFFWTKNSINALADKDDVLNVTKKVNGGTIGLAERTTFLLKAKELVGTSLPEITLAAPTHRVVSDSLNIRSKPEISESTRLGVLHAGALLEQLEPASSNWMRVRAILDRTPLEGYVSSKAEYVKALQQTVAAAAAALIPSAASSPAPIVIPPIVHLKEGRPDITRARDSGHAYPLGESGMPRRAGATPSAHAKSLVAIAEFLNPEKTQHRRYAPETKKTYCNIYAYDFVYLAGAYLPRVWWTRKSLMQFQAGATVAPIYGDTVTEMTANSLFQWFADFGGQYGWQRLHALTAIQVAANAGDVCIIVARNKLPEASGHIAAVVPEHDAWQAGRNAQGEVVSPITSQAGRNNYTFRKETKAWWRDEHHGDFSLWSHE
jgi:predicted chitinase